MNEEDIKRILKRFRDIPSMQNLDVDDFICQLYNEHAEEFADAVLECIINTFGCHVFELD